MRISLFFSSYYNMRTECSVGNYDCSTTTDGWQLVWKNFIFSMRESARRRGVGWGVFYLRLSFFCKEDHGPMGAKILFSYWITTHSVISLSSSKTVSASLWGRRAALCGQLAALCCHSIALCYQLIPLCCLHPLPYAEKSRRRCRRMETAKTSVRDWLFVIFLTKWGLLLCGEQPGTGIALREGVRTKFQGTYSG